MHFALCPTQCRARVDNGSFRTRLVFAGHDAPRVCSSRLSQAQDLQHLGRYGAEGQLRSWCFAGNTERYAQCKLCSCSPRGDGTGAVLGQLIGPLSAMTGTLVQVQSWTRCSCPLLVDPDSTEYLGIAAVAVPTMVVDVAASCSDQPTRTVEGPQIHSSTWCS